MPAPFNAGSEPVNTFKIKLSSGRVRRAYGERSNPEERSGKSASPEKLANSGEPFFASLDFFASFLCQDKKEGPPGEGYNRTSQEPPGNVFHIFPVIIPN